MSLCSLEIIFQDKSVFMMHSERLNVVETTLNPKKNSLVVTLCEPQRKTCAVVLVV